MCLPSPETRVIVYNDALLIRCSEGGRALTLWQAIVLGILQGATEFLPVSSSGHLVLVPWLLGWPAPGLAFDTVAHLGTMVAVLAYFWRDWVRLFRGGWKLLLGRNLDHADGRVLVMLIVASVPALFVGFMLEEFVEVAFATPPVVAFCLLVTAALLVTAERLGRPSKMLGGMIWTDSIIVGLAQALAILPGISRSGSTIAGGLWRGLRREEAARFSFLMATPIIFAAGFRQLLMLANEGELASQGGYLLVGFLSSVVVGYICIWWLLGFLRRQRLYGFAVYCAALGVFGLVVAVVRG